jgi:threonine/homoserine/homoserine lactone efflux protein
VSLQLYLAFLVAASVLVVIPGPTVLLVVSHALSGGRRSLAWTVPGVGLGDATALTLSVLGLGAVLAASATLFAVVKFAGAGYLLYLGIKLWRKPAAGLPSEARGGETAGPAMLRQAFTVTALNPKSIVFFVAFLPQFVTAGQPLVPQFAILGITFVVLAVVNATVYGLLASGLHGGFRASSGRVVNQVGGAALVSAALMLAMKRAD